MNRHMCDPMPRSSNTRGAGNRSEMATSPTGMMISDLIDRYSNRDASPQFSRLYPDGRFVRVFANLHESLNSHFASINERARSSRHYWAANSRDFLALIDELNDVLAIFHNCEIIVTFAAGYRAAVDRCTPWIVASYGSEIPDDFEPIDLIKYEPVFVQPDTQITLKKSNSPRNLKMEGEGSYAIVYSFVDPDYGIKFALKRARRNLPSRDLMRFIEEFRILKQLSFPYIVEVYSYSAEDNEYTMEFCQDTLRSYIDKNNARLSFATRKRVALQFLYGINYLHLQNILHRDISLQNVLLKVFDKSAVLVKLSDFGLVKDRRSKFTRTQTELKGTIQDPRLTSFRDYNVQNEIYAIGYILSFIFTGREALQLSDPRVGTIIQRCVTLDLSDRYTSLPEIISEVEKLTVSPLDAPA